MGPFRDRLFTCQIDTFCLGGSNSVRGWSSCDLAVGRSFSEASVEYRFPIWSIVSGAVFVDGGIIAVEFVGGFAAVWSGKLFDIRH